MSMTNQDIDAVCGLVNDLCGIYLDESKSYLIESRLADLAKRHECQSYVDLVKKVRNTPDQQLKGDVIDAITTNETHFFRDTSPFEALKHKALPELIDSKAGTIFPKRIRVWSAACSSGQEAYSIAITLHELIPDIHQWDVKILATDISDKIIAQASRGVYAEHEIVRGMSRERLERFFVEGPGGWQIRDEIRSLVSFERRNLLEALAMPGRFDVVFCRNVAIYFTKDVRSDLFHRIAETMSPAGYLFVGSQESLGHLGKRFTPMHHCRSTFYRPNLAVETDAIAKA